MGMRSPRLDLPSLLKATGIKGATLAGAEDMAFRLRLEALLEDVENARLNFLGRVVARHRFAGMLRNRLGVRQWIADHPETLEVPIRHPIFIVGHPRTGTTLLYELLALDPASRAPRLWEMDRLVPPSRPGDETDERIAKFERDLATLQSFMPDIMIAHAVDARSPEECFPLLENTALSLSFFLYFDIPRYWERMKSVSDKEARDVYSDYRRQLQVLQSPAPGCFWLSKSPAHMYFLGELFGAFPDAHVIMPHREPLESIPSVCSLTAIVRSASSDDVQAASAGAAAFQWYLEVSHRAEAARSKADPARFIDVTYSNLLADPVGVVKSIYAHVGRSCSPEFERSMREWLAANPQHKHGVHRYSLAQFGLDADEVRKATSDYRARYLAVGGDSQEPRHAGQ